MKLTNGKVIEQTREYSTNIYFYILSLEMYVVASFRFHCIGMHICYLSFRISEFFLCYCYYCGCFCCFGYLLVIFNVHNREWVFKWSRAQTGNILFYWQKFTWRTNARRSAINSFEWANVSITQNHFIYDCMCSSTHIAHWDLCMSADPLHCI